MNRNCFFIPAGTGKNNVSLSSIVILDESQNWDRNTLKTILSRSDEDNNFIIMGSNNQIDISYLGKATNALTFMMSQCGMENSSYVRIQDINLTKVVRSRISEWADVAFEKETKFEAPCVSP
ncbi:MAG: PhoH family protein [Cycloclasticus sp.]